MTGGSAGTSGASASSSGEREHEGPIARFFRSLFGDDEDERRGAYSETYGEAVRRGNYAVTVTAIDEDEVDRAERLLNECGAIDIDERSRQWRSEGSGAAVTGVTRAGAADEKSMGALDAGATRTLREVEEELKVGKRAVARGGVRVFTRLRETPVEESIRLREEHAQVQRRDVDRPATEADLRAFEEGSIEVRETAEEPVVSKAARVVGEVEVGKTVTEREETVRDTVRRTQVEVEPIEGGTRREGVLAREGGVVSDEGGPLGDHPVGTGVGAVAGGMAAGAAAGTVAGPVGTVAGAAAGAVAGGLAGKAVAEEVNPEDDRNRSPETRGRSR